MTFNLDDRLIQDIQQIGKSYAIQQIVLFGSRARGNHKRTSDIDLAVFLLPGFNSKGHVSSDIEDLNTLLKIDTVFINEHVDQILLENIEKEGISLYERT